MKNSELLTKLSCASAKAKWSIARNHFKYQGDSIRMDYELGAVVEVRQEIGFHPFTTDGKDQSRETFCFWIYQERPQIGELRFVFQKNGQTCCWFPFHLDFSGWRTSWLIYERDMIGRPEEGMDCLKIEFPEAPGSLYISDMQLNAKIDPRHPTPDRQVRQINPNIGASGHWMKLLHFEECRKKAETGVEKKGFYSENLRKDSATIWQRQMDYLTEKYANRQKMLSYEEIRERYRRYRWEEIDGVLTGCSIDSNYTMEIIPAEQRKEWIAQGISIDMRKTGSLLLDLALWYQKDKSEKVFSMYTTLMEHLWDQGLAYGSSLGTTHHYGYVLKELFDSIFFMSRPLSAAKPQLLDKLREMTIWITGLGRINCPTEECSINIDVLNTYSQAMLMVILLGKEEAYRQRQLIDFAGWLNASIEYAKGLEGTFKPDGSMFHHCNHYPAYGLDGLKSLTPLIYFLAGTIAEISPRAYDIVENALEKIRWYCNLKHWPTALSARHPKTDGEHTHLNSDIFYYMALAQIISGRGKTMGNIYLRLEGPLSMVDGIDKPKLTQKRIAELTAKGCQAEATPNGHLTMNWACAGFHRRGEWLAAIRGHNRYLWSHESYVANNLYGRYISYGHLQILGKGRPTTLYSSGYQAEGFDWNCFPGTTVIELPFPELRSKVYNVDEFSGYEEMLLTDEAFAGGLSMGANGIFAMKLHGHAKYDDSHRANLSSFFFGDRILRLGSDISSSDTEHRSITTLFQSRMDSSSAPVFINKRTIKGLEYFDTKHRNGLVLADAYGNSYFVPHKTKLEIRCGQQTTPAQDTGIETTGCFAKAVIDHGKAPKKAGYEYVIGVNQEPLVFFEQTRKWLEDPFYRIHQKNRQAHIVEFLEEKTFAYVFFTAYRKRLRAQNDILRSVDRPCLCMIAADGKEQLSLSFCDPDLRLYEGVDAEQYDAEGKQIERSVYSRPWMHHKSIGRETKIVLQGLFSPEQKPTETKEQTGLIAAEQNPARNETTLIFWGIDGGSAEVRLKRIVL